MAVERTDLQPEDQKKSFQDWCIDTLFLTLKSSDEYQGDLHDQGYIYSLKSLINHYASMRRCTDEYKKAYPRYKKGFVNLWKDYLHDYNRESFFSTLMQSESARYMVENEMDVDTLRDELHFEHITPCGFIYDRLCKLSGRKDFSREMVAEELKYDHLVLITKEESMELDGKGRVFTKDDIAECKKWFPELVNDWDSPLDDLEGRRMKDLGFGFLRMIHLRNLKTNADWHRSEKFYAPDGNGGMRECPPSQWARFFIDSKMIITTN
jgi:hypothetical protein